MRDRQLYRQIQGIQKSRKVVSVNVSIADDEVEVVEHAGDRLSRPKCGKSCLGYDKRRRRWRPLDTCQFKTLLVADILRVPRAEQGIVEIDLRWAEPRSRT